MRTPDNKVAAYSFWNKAGAMQRGQLYLESYVYINSAGRLELDNQQADSAKAQKIVKEMLGKFNKTQMQAPLPPKYHTSQVKAKAEYLAYITILDSLNPDGSSDMSNPDWVGNYLRLGEQEPAQ